MFPSHDIAERIKSILINDYQINQVALGYLDITFFRDDFRRTKNPLEANQTKIDFLVIDNFIVRKKNPAPVQSKSMETADVMPVS